MKIGMILFALARLLRQPAGHVAGRHGGPVDRGRAAPEAGVVTNPSRRSPNRRRSRKIKNRESRGRPRNLDAETKTTPKPSPRPKTKTRRKEAAAADEKPEKKERKTAKAETKRMKVVVSLDGTFTAEKMTPVDLRPDAWSDFEIVGDRRHGMRFMQARHW